MQLTSEFSADSSTGVDSFEDYLQLEDTVFSQLDERGVLRIPGNFLLRLRHNPFYSYLESRVLRWVENPGSS